MGKKKHKKNKYKESSDLSGFDFDEDLLQAYNDGEITEEELLDDPRMKMCYKSYYSASDEDREKERKRRKKMAGLTKDRIKDIYEALGGVASAKEYASNLREFADQVGDWLILMNSPAEITQRCIEVILQGADDLEDGCPWIFDHDEILDYVERTESYKQ